MLIDEIRALPAAITGQRDTSLIADELNKVRPPRLRSFLIGTGTILAKFNGLGGQFLDALQTIGQTDRDVYWLLTGNILRGSCDVGDAATQAGLQNLKTVMPTFAAGIDALIALGIEPNPVSEFEVRCACWSDIGEWLV